MRRFASDTDALYRSHLSTGRARLASLLGGQEEVRSRGSIITLASGDEMLDCGGYGVFLLGHGHPRVVQAVQAQAERHALSSRLLLDPTQAQAAAALARAAPEGLDRVYFATSGADAVEAGLKLARMHGKRRIVSAVGGFHGKTFAALSVSGNPTFRKPFEPLLPGVSSVPFGDAEAIAAILAEHPGECCVLLEPIQSEGGVRVPDDRYLHAVVGACRKHGALLILDEIATGLGRIGHWWGCERFGVDPDVMLVGKPLSGGVVPVSAVVATEAAFAPLDRDPIMHSATFAGSPIAMAAVSATIDVLEDERVPDRAAALGLQLIDELREALADGLDEGVVTDVRGAGLLIGVEFAEPAQAGGFALQLVSQGVIPNHCLNGQTVVRLTPPAFLDEREVGWLVEACSAAAAAVIQARRTRLARD